jgi:two-component system, NarL family, nitrate/nitrite response regulator NarL
MRELMENPIKILLVDDHVIVRAGLRMLIENHKGMAVVGEAGGRRDAIAIAASEQPDIILLDLDMGNESGLDFLRELLATATRARVVMLTGVRDTEAHRRAVLMGAMGLVLKDKAAEVLIRAIERVHAGEVWLDRSLTASVLSEISNVDRTGKPDPEAKKIGSLTSREREIVGLVCEGLKNKQIADRLFISEATVRNHLTSILSKLELSDRFEVALFAYRNHLAKPPS